MNNRDIVGNLVRLSTVHRYRISQAAHSSGLWYGQPPLLQYIHRHPDCTQSELCTDTGVSAPSIAVSVKRLIKAGLVEKSRDENDQRCNRLHLTQRGEQAHGAFRDICDEVDRQLFNGFTEEEKLQLDGYIRRLTGNLNADSIGHRELREFIDKERKVD